MVKIEVGDTVRKEEREGDIVVNREGDGGEDLDVDRDCVRD